MGRLRRYYVRSLADKAYWNYSPRRAKSSPHSRICRSWTNPKLPSASSSAGRKAWTIASTLEMELYAPPAAKPVAAVQSDNDTTGDKGEEVPVATVDSK